MAFALNQHTKLLLAQLLIIVAQVLATAFTFSYGVPGLAKTRHSLDEGDLADECFRVCHGQTRWDVAVVCGIYGF